MAQEIVLHDKDLEELVLISLLKSPPTVKDYLLGAVKEEHFQTPWWREIHHRIKNLVREKNQIPNEVDILHDPVISEPIKTAIRASLIYQNNGSIQDHARCKSAIEQLSHYSKSRKLHGLHNQIGEYFLKGDKDLKKIVGSLSNKLYEINTDTENFESSIFHLTNEEESNSLVNKILNDRDDQYIPTGMAQFDKLSKGLPRGGLTIVAATTGGGKSLMALNMVKAQALAGYRTCLVSLEMNEFELLERRFSSVTKVTLSDIKNNKLTIQEKERAILKFNEYTNKVREAGGLEDYKCKMNNLTIEELLYGLKPFGYDVIIIDYLGLLKGVGGDNQWQKLSEAARFGKIFAEENNMNVIALAQLDKEGEIRYSRGILEHANNSFSWVFGKKEHETGIIEVEQKKARMSQRFNFYLKMDFGTMTCSDLDDREKTDYLQREEKEVNNNNRGNNNKGNFTPKKTSFFGD